MRVFIYGAGAHGRIALDILRAQGTAEDVYFVDDDPKQRGTRVAGVEVVGGAEELDRCGGKHGVVLAIGRPDIRLRIARALRSKGKTFVNAVHPSAVLMDSCRVGVGNVISPGAVIEAGARVGDHVLVNSRAVIAHDCVVGDGSIISVGANVGGGAELGEGAFIGMGAQVLPRRKVGAGAVVGAAAMVASDVASRVMVVGAPAKMVWVVDEGFDWSRLF